MNTPNTRTSPPATHEYTQKDAATPSTLSTIISLNRLSAEEASRYGHEKIDLEHLLLALTLTDTPAGKALRSQGVTWNAVTEAIRGLSATRLAHIGISTDAPLMPTGHITATGTTPRLDAVFKEGSGTKPDLIKLTIALLEEPSGTIAQILQKIGASTKDIHEQLHTPATQAAARTERTKQIQACAVIPASKEAVDAYVQNPHNLPAWEPMLGGCEIEDNPDSEGWIARPSKNHSSENQNANNHAKAREKPTFAIQRNPRKPNTWEIRKIGYANSPTVSITLETRNTQGGTALTVTVRWILPQTQSTSLSSALRSARRTIFAWWAQIVRKMYVRNIAHAISRTIREQHLHPASHHRPRQR